MKKAILMLADGFEEVEALTSVDMLRRAGVEVKTASIMKRLPVNGAHGITVVADLVMEEADWSEYNAIILPGGMPGTTNLNANEKVKEEIREFFEAGKLVAAICAGPTVLGSAGVLQGKKATCYPGCEKGLLGATYTKAKVEQDGNLITANGPGAAFAFAFRIVTYLCGEEKSAEVAAGAQYFEKM